MAFATRLAAGAPLAVRYTKLAVNKLVKDALNVAFDTSTALELRDVPQRGPPGGTHGDAREAARPSSEGADHAMDLYDAILTTRAIRRFTDEPVTDDEVLTCLRAAVQGPSGGNIQPWQFLVVTDAGRRKRAIGDLYRRAYDRYERGVARR